MEELSIGEAARRSGVMPSTLRYYEDVGVLPKVRRIGGRRRYDAKLLTILEVVRFAQGAGFSLTEVKLLFNGFSEKNNLSARWKALAQDKLEQLDAIERQARKMKTAIREGLACGCVQVEDCLLVRAARAKPRQSGTPKKKGRA